MARLFQNLYFLCFHNRCFDFFVGKDSASANAIELARIAEPQPVLANSFAKVDIKKIPTQRKSELGLIIGILELLLEFYYDLMPSSCIRKSATTYCCM